MVTLDNVIESIAPFDGKLDERRLDYEKAKQGLQKLESAYVTFEKSLKSLTGFDELNIPADKKETKISIGDVEFNIVSIPRIKRPQYKSAVEQFENRILGITDLVKHNKTITGVVKKDDDYFVEASWLRDDFEITVSGILIPETKHTITYSVPESINFEKPIALTDNLGLANPDNAMNFVLMDKRKESLETFVADYEIALKKEAGRKDKTTVQVTDDAGYEVKKSTSKGPDWKYVVTTLMLVPTEKKSVGELYILADDNIPFVDKLKLPTYTIWNRTSKTDDNKSPSRLYVSLPSVYDRIQELKGEETIRARRLSIQRKDLV